MSSPHRGATLLNKVFVRLVFWASRAQQVHIVLEVYIAFKILSICQWQGFKNIVCKLLRIVLKSYGLKSNQISA